MGSTDKTSRRKQSDRRTISMEEIFKAGVGALREEGVHRFDDLSRSGDRFLGSQLADETFRDDQRMLLTDRRWIDEREPTGPVKSSGHFGGRYSDAPDAVIRTEDGSKIVIEVKRARTSSPPASAEGSVRRLPEIIESMMPSQVPTAPMVLQARRNSAARVELMNEFGLLSSSDVAELNRSKAGNRAALASRWKREGKIFAVKHDGKDWFPGFQFETAGRPREIVGRVLDALGGARSWDTALWFTGASGYLDGRRPVDLLDDDPEAVVEAARRESVEVYF